MVDGATSSKVPPEPPNVFVVVVPSIVVVPVVDILHVPLALRLIDPAVIVNVIPVKSSVIETASGLPLMVSRL